jgi:uncharacterized membrane protein
MDVREKYQARLEKQRQQLWQLYQKADQGNWSWTDECDQREEYLKHKHKFSNAVWFGLLSYDDQIQIAVHTDNEDFVRRLDGDQLAAYRIMKN